MQPNLNSWENMSKIKWFLFIVICLISTAGIVNAAPAIIRAGDLISVWVKGEPELSVEKQVNRDGSILLPLIGSVGVNGLKTTDAAKLISSMLEDGFLRDPLVQVSVKSSNAPAKRKTREVASPSSTPQRQQRSRPEQADVPRSAEQKQLLVEVVDASTFQGIGGVAMMLGNRIYQSNRLGQILIDGLSGHAVVIADGFQTLTGNIESLVRPGNPGKIQLRRVQVADSITFQVVDAFTKKPVSGVEVTLDDMKINGNRQGTFKVRMIKKEFGEILLKRRGYKAHRQVVDYKGPETQTISMVRNE